MRVDDGTHEGYLHWAIDATTMDGQPCKVEVAVSLGEQEIEGVDVATVELVGGGEYVMACLSASHHASFGRAVALVIDAVAADQDVGVFDIGGYDGYDDRPCLVRLYVADDPGLAILEVHADKLYAAVLDLDGLAELHTAGVDTHAVLTADRREDCSA
jgi:hypothetical protein